MEFFFTNTFFISNRVYVRTCFASILICWKVNKITYFHHLNFTNNNIKRCVLHGNSRTADKEKSITAQENNILRL